MYSPQHLARNFTPKKIKKSNEENKVTAEFKIQSGKAKLQVDPEIIRKRTDDSLLLHSHVLS